VSPRPPLWLRRLLRPLIPDRLMAVVRLREHSRQVRVNVDVVVEGRLAQRRWLATTPDTYRVRPRGTFGGDPPAVEVTLPGEAVPSGAPVIAVARRPLTPAQQRDLSLPLADPDVDAVVLGEAVPPRLVGRRRTEPQIGPRAVAVRRAAFQEVGGLPAGDEPLPGLLARLRDAGHRIALVPVPPTGAPVSRTDPISHAAGSAVVLALVPMHDIGGGSRGAQLALELLRQGWHVTYVAAYGTAESQDLGLRFVHPDLEQHRAGDLDVAALVRRVQVDERLLICEAPLPGYLEPARWLGQAGYRVVYDLIDDWTAPSLGGDWYDEAVERAFTELADVLAGSAPDLVERLEKAMPGRPVLLVPNAVNADIFGGGPGAEPDDLPPGDGPLLGYHGSLYGDWFDWEALRGVAEAFPDARVVVIGDEPTHRPAMPSNVHFLGLKPQRDLPRYLQCLDVGLLPFAVTDVTHAVSPLKVYEYLASGVPVAAPALRSLAGLEGLEGVVCADLVPAVTEALALPHPDPTQVLRRHSWAARLALMLNSDVAAAAVATPVRIVRRPAAHRTRSGRRQGRPG
jgi:glycosyltransferase involved in cell wall biosynthesis